MATLLTSSTDVWARGTSTDNFTARIEYYYVSESASGYVIQKKFYVWATGKQFSSYGHASWQSATFAMNAGTSTGAEHAVYTENVTVGYENSLTDTVNAYYEGGSSGTVYKSEVSASYTVPAKYFTVSFNSNGGSTVSAISVKYNGTYGTLPTPTRTGYTFNGWYYNDSKISSTTSMTVYGDHTLTASWSANPYTYNIVYVSSTGKSLGSTTATYNFDTTNTISAPAKTGYTTPASQSVTWNSTTAKTITFTYTPIEYTISWNSASPDTGKGEVTYTIESPDYTLNTNPQYIGHTFLGWTGSNGTTPQITVTIPSGSTGDKSYTGNWQIITYPVTYDGKNGTDVPEDQIKTYDVDLTLSDQIPVRPAYIFRGWDTSSDAKTVVYNPGDVYSDNAELNLYAVWLIADKITLSFTEPDIAMVCESNGTAIVPDVQIPYTATYTENNQGFTYYYEFYYIANGKEYRYEDMYLSTYESGTITVPSSFFREYLESGANRDKLVLKVDCWTYEKIDELKDTYTVVCMIPNFTELKSDLRIIGTGTDTLTFTHIVKFPESYKDSIDMDEAFSSIVYYLDDVEITPTLSSIITVDTPTLFFYNWNLPTSSLSDDSVLRAVFTDGLTEIEHLRKIGQGVDQRKVYAYKDGRCKCMNFINSDDELSAYNVDGTLSNRVPETLYIYKDGSIKAKGFANDTSAFKFTKDGIVHASSFIEA